MRRCNRRFELASLTILHLASVVAVVLFSSTALRAQDVYSQGTRDARRAERDARQRDLWELERMKARRPKKTAEEQMAYQEIKEDFEQLQLSNHALLSEAGPALNYEQIRKEASEIRKRAARLKSNLTLPQPEKDASLKEGGEAAAGDLKLMIEALDALVKEFVWSPIFQRPNVVDIEEATKASKSLEGIIRMSERLHKRAEVLAQNR